jgi:hypothetical protein
MDIQAALYERVLIWAMDVDPDDCRKEIEWRRGRHPALNNRKLARRMMMEYSMISLGEGALTALASGPFLAIPAALVDTAFILRMAARLNGCIGLLANPQYFADEAWRADTVALIGNDPVAQQGARRTALQVTNRVALQLATRAGVRRLIPVLGGLVGGAWNFLEVRTLAARIFDYHFDSTVSDSASKESALNSDPLEAPRTSVTAPDVVGVVPPRTAKATAKPGSEKRTSTSRTKKAK